MRMLVKGQICHIDPLFRNVRGLNREQGMGFVTRRKRVSDSYVRAYDGDVGAERHALPFPDHAKPDAGRGGRQGLLSNGLCRCLHYRHADDADTGPACPAAVLGCRAAAPTTDSQSSSHE